MLRFCASLLVQPHLCLDRQQHSPATDHRHCIWYQKCNVPAPGLSMPILTCTPQTIHAHDASRCSSLTSTSHNQAMHASRPSPKNIFCATSVTYHSSPSHTSQMTHCIHHVAEQIASARLYVDSSAHHQSPKFNHLLSQMHIPHPQGCAKRLPVGRNDSWWEHTDRGVCILSCSVSAKH